MPTLTFNYAAKRATAKLIISPFLDHNEAVRQVATALNLDVTSAVPIFLNRTGSQVTSLPSLADGQVIDVVLAQPTPASTPGNMATDPHNDMQRRATLRMKVEAEFAAEAARGEKSGTLLTMDPPDIRFMINKLNRTKNQNLSAAGYSSERSLSLMEANWGKYITHTANFPRKALGKNVRPEGNMKDWDPRLLALLAILSEFTPAQGMYMGELLGAAVELRLINKMIHDHTPTLMERDVLRTINDLVREYEQVSGAPEPAKVVKKRERKKANRQRKKDLGQAVKQGELEGDTGLPVRETEVEKLTKKFEKKANVPEHMLSSSDEDDEL